MARVIVSSADVPHLVAVVASPVSKGDHNVHRLFVDVAAFLLKEAGSNADNLDGARGWSR